MKKEKKQKETRKLRIVLDVLIILIGFVFLYFGIKDAMSEYTAYKQRDSVAFHKAYSYVKADECVYKYVSLKKTNKLLKEDSTILIGNPEDPWTQVIVKPLNDIYKDKIIYYLETSEIKTDSKEYKEFKKALKIDEIASPIIIITKSQKTKVYTKEDIISKEYNGAPIEYFNEENIKKLRELVTS